MANPQGGGDGAAAAEQPAQPGMMQTVTKFMFIYMLVNTASQMLLGNKKVTPEQVAARRAEAETRLGGGNFGADLGASSAAGSLAGESLEASSALEVARRTKGGKLEATVTPQEALANPLTAMMGVDMTHAMPPKIDIPKFPTHDARGRAYPPHRNMWADGQRFEVRGACAAFVRSRAV